MNHYQDLLLLSTRIYLVFICSTILFPLFGIEAPHPTGLFDQRFDPLTFILDISYPFLMGSFFIGLLTRPLALALSVGIVYQLMVGAFGSNLEGLEMPFIWLILTNFLLIYGPGNISLDSIFTGKKNLET
jgi:uncharacterized membrane protein YphA (DoxX/SURF4 family)